jgi:hypothetical protein
MRIDPRFRLQFIGLAGLALSTVVALSACPGKLNNGDDLLHQGEGGGVMCPDAPERIFTPKCGGSGCHSPPDPANGLDLVSPGVAQRVVDHAAKMCLGNLADPTDPEGSVIVQKLGDSPPCGERMPLHGDKLSEDDITCIKVWIVELQPPDGMGGAGGTGGIGGAGGSGTGGSGTGGAGAAG